MKRSKRIGTFRVYMLYTGDIPSPDCIGFKCYIGYTGCKVEERIRTHFHEAMTAKIFTKKLNWLRKLKVEDIKYIILKDDIVTEQEALIQENLYIIKLKSCGYEPYMKNGDNGGRGPGRYSPEAIENRRVSKLGNKWNEGKKHSEETIRKQSEALKGRVLSAESIAQSAETRKRNNEQKRKEGVFHIKNKRKFNESQILDIFNKFNNELLSCSSIAKKYNCPTSTISTVLYHKQSYPDYKMKYNLVIKSKPKDHYTSIRVVHIQKVNENRKA